MMPFCACIRFSAWSNTIDAAAGTGAHDGGEVIEVMVQEVLVQEDS